MNRKLSRLIVTASALIFTILACRTLPAISEAGPRPTSTPAPTATPASLEEIITRAIEQAKETGEVTVQITEAHITKALELRLLQEQNPLFSNPQVFLREGNVEFLADVENSGLTTTLKVIMSVAIGPDGVPVFVVESAELGILPVPPEMAAALEDAINQLLAAQFASAQAGLQIKDIRIADGFMEVTVGLRPPE